MARASSARVKINRSYDVGEAAETVGVSDQTIRAWIKQGLPVLSSQKPILILGCALKEFLAARSGKGGVKLSLGEFRCFTCKVPRTAAYGMADYRALTEARGQLHAFCSECGGPVSRFVGRSSVFLWLQLYEIGGDYS